jgi:hypothetical protein
VVNATNHTKETGATMSDPGSDPGKHQRNPSRCATAPTGLTATAGMASLELDIGSGANSYNVNVHHGEDRALRYRPPTAIRHRLTNTVTYYYSFRR